MNDELSEETRAVIEQFAAQLGSMLVWMRTTQIRINAMKSMIDKHLSVSAEEWNQAFAEAEANLPADLTDSALGPAEIRNFLLKIQKP
jgi:hypothetical protein